MYVITSLSSFFNSNIQTHIHIFNLTENIRVLRTRMNTLCIIIAIVELIENIKLLFFRFLFFVKFFVFTLFVQICIVLLWN